MDQVVNIGGAGGHLGDSQVAVPQLLKHPNLDYLVLDYLAEATMSMLARAAAVNPVHSYARDFTEWVWRDNLAELKRTGVKLITNAGGLDPQMCRARMQELAAEAGLSFKIAVVTGDDLRKRPECMVGRNDMFNGRPVPAADSVMTANAYFGAGPIADALRDGAEVVITGRVVDSALVLGPLIREFGWGWEDYDKLAAGSLCGHVLECGAQATGGLFTDWRDVPDWAHIGYPVAECRSDGSFVVTKPEGTGGLCTPATVAEQILYEIGDPQHYALPDVICDFSHVTTKSVGTNRVEVRGVRGRAPSGDYKVCVTFQDGWRVTLLQPIVGRDAVEKAERQAGSILERVGELLKARGFAPFRDVRVELVGAEASYGANARARKTREVIAKIGVEHTERKALQLLLREADAHLTSMSVGTTGWFGTRPAIDLVARVVSFLVPRQTIDAMVDFDGSHTLWRAPPTPSPMPAEPIPEGESKVSHNDTLSVPLVELAWARSGDKGNTFNVGVIARRPEYLPYIRGALTVEALRVYFAHEFEGPGVPRIDRFEVPGLCALNFLFHEAMGGGQYATLRLDALAKAKAQQLLDLEIAVPRSVLTQVANS
jgi:hypothetical protein